ncbi:MAG TPA: hypothetical protein VFJ43_02565 [Bacteroidia bacterium]|nr:hypothetical protein [Bacteroidia bacterium]
MRKNEFHKNKKQNKTLKGKMEIFFKGFVKANRANPLLKLLTENNKISGGAYIQDSLIYPDK